MSKPKSLIYASGTAKGGGSGAEKLIINSRYGQLPTNIVGLVSNHKHGGVRALADKYKIPFYFFPKPWTAERYQEFAFKSGADFFLLSGWLKLVKGLDLKTSFNPKTVINNHPSLIPNFCGEGMYAQYVHEAVIPAHRRGEITHTGFTMHFVDDKFDHGPIFFQCRVKIDPYDTADSIGKKVNKQEHIYQSEITKLVVSGRITWDGVNPDSLKVPSWYSIVRDA